MSEPLTISQRLLLSRRQVDLDQKELARRASVSNGYISDIERGKVTNVGIEVVESIARALEVSPAYLAGWEEYPLQGIQDDDDDRLVLREASPAYHVYSEEERQLIEDVRQLSEAQRRLLLKFVQLLKETPI